MCEWFEADWQLDNHEMWKCEGSYRHAPERNILVPCPYMHHDEGLVVVLKKHHVVDWLSHYGLCARVVGYGSLHICGLFDFG